MPETRSLRRGSLDPQTDAPIPLKLPRFGQTAPNPKAEPLGHGRPPLLAQLEDCKREVVIRISLGYATKPSIEGNRERIKYVPVYEETFKISLEGRAADRRAAMEATLIDIEKSILEALAQHGTSRKPKKSRQLMLHANIHASDHTEHRIIGGDALETKHKPHAFDISLPQRPDSRKIKDALAGVKQSVARILQLSPRSLG